VTTSVSSDSKRYTFGVTGGWSHVNWFIPSFQVSW
jgi:hypothetical protein